GRRKAHRSNHRLNRDQAGTANAYSRSAVPRARSPTQRRRMFGSRRSRFECDAFTALRRSLKGDSLRVSISLLFSIIRRSIGRRPARNETQATIPEKETRAWHFF